MNVADPCESMDTTCQKVLKVIHALRVAKASKELSVFTLENGVSREERQELRNALQLLKVKSLMWATLQGFSIYQI